MSNQLDEITELFWIISELNGEVDMTMLPILVSLMNSVLRGLLNACQWLLTQVFSRQLILIEDYVSQIVMKCDLMTYQVVVDQVMSHNFAWSACI